jgi:hypothetical protein
VCLVVSYATGPCVCGEGIASLTRQSLCQCVALSTADGIFGVRDKNARISLMRLAIEEAMFSDMHFDRKSLGNRSSEQTTNVMKRLSAQCSITRLRDGHNTRLASSML